MNTIKRITISLIVTISIGLIPATMMAQQGEALPTLRLDRIPAQPAFPGQTRAIAAKPTEHKVETVVSGLALPWALAFLPGGDMLLTERRNGLKIVSADGNLSEPLDGVPAASGHRQGGWFDVALHPDFSNNRLVYFSYFAPAEDDPETRGIPQVARARLSHDQHRLEDVQVVLDGKGTQEMHFGRDGMLFVAGSGDFSADPQALSGYNGKVLRVNSDGSIPKDNPYRNTQNALAEIYTVGHRDIAGIDTHPDTGEIWISEHGPRGGDEVNVIRPGANYGWKVISYGTQYSGEPVGDGASAKQGMQQPVYFWRPSIAPSGLLFYKGDMFPEWKNSVFVTALSGQHLTRLELNGERVVAEERFLVDLAKRIREARVGPDGALYVLTNEENDAPKGTADLLKISR